ncbi:MULTISPECIES: sensor histidine kinase [unclassified Flavobacterium]|nr:MULTISPECIES: histidine kinase [unclassified Flavobacterium]RKS03571.1 histidine kinase [Flavobacterium sp. 102]
MRKIVHSKMNDKNLMLRFFVSKKHRWFRHSILIVFSILALYYTEAEYTQPAEMYSRILLFMQVMVMSYVNMYYLVPKFLFKNNYLAYSVSAIAVIALVALTHDIFAAVYEPDLLPHQNDNINFISFSFVTLVLIIASAAVKLFQQWVLDAQLIYELKQAKTSAELEQLKNQINPHFLFNMLNNANVLTKKDPDKASQVLIKLSDLLRYQLYDSSREKVFLTSDIHFLEDFLNLEKIRRDSFDFIISKEGDLNGVQIPPLLFISFVENAVKHNNDSEKASYVNLEFKSHNGELVFKCTNSKPVVKAVKNNSGGLGLNNIKRRLQLLFPEAHELKIENSKDTFRVTLTIRL